jgi:putative spermidine/putrescine transport system ATP-binding protein
MTPDPVLPDSAPQNIAPHDFLPHDFESAISARDVRKTFGSGASVVHAVDGVDLDVGHGEFFCLLGPSGSGKTTLLRMIAGFELPTGGTIRLDGVDVTGLPPYARDVNTVFQDYALFPHMSVAKNVEYGLRVKKVAKSARGPRVQQALDLVQLGGYGNRKPSQLSGGQRQRIALARALVNRPKVLLLDEPLGALDLKLRQQMQVELKAIQQQARITFIFVTHDQEEALTMSDRIAVFNNGRIEQVGTPREVYEQPATTFVAGFVGTSNLLAGNDALAVLGKFGTFTVRPERITIRQGHQTSSADVQTDAVVEHVEYLGPVSRFVVRLPSGATLSVLAPNITTQGHDLQPGDRVVATFARESAFEILGATAADMAVSSTASK